MSLYVCFALKRMIVEAYLGGEPLPALSKKFDVCRHPIRSWIEKYELGEFDDEHVRTDLVPDYEGTSRTSWPRRCAIRPR